MIPPSLTLSKPNLTVFLLLLLMTGCVIPPYYEYLHWHIELTMITKPSDAERKHGVLRHIRRGQFEDNLVRIDGDTRDPMETFFVLTNMSQYDLKIDWRKAQFTDIYDRTSSVSVTQMQRPLLDKALEGHTQDDGSLTEIKRAQSVRVRVTPPGRPQIRRVSGWEISGMTGRSVKVSIPLQIEDESYEYISTFRVTNLGTSM